MTKRFAFGQRLDRFVDLFEGGVLSERCIHFCCDSHRDTFPTTSLSFPGAREVRF